MSVDKKGISPKKRKVWPWALVVILAVLLAVILVLPGRRGTPNFNLRQATVEKGSLTVTVVGTGHLDYDESSSIEVPDGLLVDRLFFEAGDRVNQGERLASFDPLSIRLAIDQVLAEIENLDRAIARASSYPDSRVVRAGQAGRVKALYIEKGDDAGAIHEEYGAAILLSLDGRMAVTFESTADLEAGDKVRVRLADGRRREGTVERRAGSLLTVTLSDDGPGIRDQVTLETEEGEVIGEGKLDVNRPLALLATEGRVREIHVSNNQKVAAGKALFTLEELTAGPGYDQLFTDRKEYRERLAELLKLQKTGELSAPFDLFVLATSLEEGERTGEPGGGQVPAAVSQSVSAALTVAPVDYYALLINVDELDILSVRPGQGAAITFDAIDGRVFQGTIDRVATRAVETGGIAKYPARLLIGADPQMKPGMSVTATITVDEKWTFCCCP